MAPRFGPPAMGDTKFPNASGLQEHRKSEMGLRNGLVRVGSSPGNADQALLITVFGVFWLWVALKKFPHVRRIALDDGNRRDT